MFSFDTAGGAVRVVSGDGVFAEIPTCGASFVAAETAAREDELRLYFRADPETPMEGDFTLPGIVMRPDDLLVIPHYEGYVFRADDARPIMPRRVAMTGTGLSMAFFGIVRGGCWLLYAVITNLDAHLLLPFEAGLNRPRVVFLPEKGKWGYDREVRLLCGEGGITEMCLAYRRIAEEKGLRVPFREKAKRLPDIAKLAGAANVWLWNDDAMDKLYDPSFPYRVPTKEQVDRRLAAADEMRSAGMERVLWSIFDENIERREVMHMQGLGWITTVYDIYTDVIPHDILDLIPDTRRMRCQPRIGYWPDGVAVRDDGSFAPAWKLRCKDGEFRDQNRLCDIAMYECAARTAPEQNRNYGLNGRFIDVTAGSVTECFSPVHPTTRRSSMAYKNKLFAMLRENGMFTGTEVGCEDVAATVDYNEGLMSPAEHRMPDAGRRMCHLYHEDDIAPKIREFMLDPVLRAPLWELVYHGCLQSYWYWGDSANCMPDLMPLRDAFCVLYGLPELYSFSVSAWETLKDLIVASYHRTVPFAASVGMASLDSFEYVGGDPRIQRTTFSNGRSAVANFTGADIEYGGRVVKAGTAETF